MIKKRELLEEISRIQKIMDVQKQQLDEQAAFSRFLSKVIPSLGLTFEHNFFNELRTILKKDLTTVTPKEMSMAFKLPQMAGFRRQIADKLMETEFETVDNILKKYNLSIPQESMNAGKELASVLEIDPAFLKDVKASWVTKKGANSTASTAGTTATTAGTTTATTAGSTIRTISQVEIDNLIKNNVKLYFPDITPKSWYSFLTKYGKPMKDRMMAATSGMANVNTEAEVSVLLNDIVNQMSKTKDKTLKVKLKNMSVAAKQKGNRPLTESNRKSYILWIAIAAAVIFVYNKISSGISDFWGEKTSPDTEGGLIDKYLPGVIDAIQGSGDTTNTAPPTNKLKDKWGLQ